MPCKSQDPWILGPRYMPTLSTRKSAIKRTDTDFYTNLNLDDNFLLVEHDNTDCTPTAMPRAGGVGPRGYRPSLRHCVVASTSAGPTAASTHHVTLWQCFTQYHQHLQSQNNSNCLYITQTILASVSLCRKSHCFKTANVNILCANSKHRSQLPHLYQSVACCKS